MGSMAFWYERNPNAKEVKLDAVMNFNLWTQCNTSEDSFLDIGFKISGITAAKTLYYYIPFAGVTIEDLSLKINNSKSISAIFNEKYSVEDIYASNFFWPVRDNIVSKTAFVIYSWKENGGDSAVKENQKDYTGGVCLEIDADRIQRQIISISNPQLTEKESFYFRASLKTHFPTNQETW